MANADDELIRSANRGYADGVRAALSAGADAYATAPDPYTRNLSALMLACAAGSLGSVQALVGAGANVLTRTTSEIAGAGGQTALHFAVTLTGNDEERLDIVNLLLGLGADPNAVSDSADTPLTRSAEFGHIGLCEALVAGGADPRLAPANGFTALHAAANIGHLLTVRWLLDAGAPVDALDATGGTALMTAAYRGYPDVVEELLSRGASADRAATDGRTALHYVGIYASNAFNAADNEKACAMARQLLAHGADAAVADFQGITAADLAAESDFPEVARLLRDHTPA